MVEKIQKYIGGKLKMTKPTDDEMIDEQLKLNRETKECKFYFFSSDSDDQ